MPRTRTNKKQSTLQTKKKLQALQRQVDANEQEVQHAIREKEARKKLRAYQRKGAIIRPNGTAGRHFNLQHAMNLDDKDTVYKKIRYKIIEIAKDNGLRLKTTIRYQPPTLLGTIITLAMLEIPHLAHFKDGWPVKDFLQQFLRNHTNYRRRMRYDKRSSNKATPSKHTRTHISTSCAKLPALTAHSDSDDSSDTDPGSDSDLEEIGPGSEGGLPADIAKLFKKRVEDYLKSEGCLTQTAVPTDTSQTAKVTKKSTKLKSQAAMISGKGVTTAAITKVRSERAKPLAVTKQQQKEQAIHSKTSAKDNVIVRASMLKPVQHENLDKETAEVTPSIHHDSRSPPPSLLPSFSFSPQDIPDTCPNEDCEDLVPAPPSPQLIHMLRSLAEHIHKEGEYGRTVLHITLHICSDIASENQLSELRQHMAERGWPVSVNFVELNNFTWSLTADVAKILSDHSARASHIIWTTLLGRITRHYRNKGVTEEEHLLAFARDNGPTTAFINELSTAGFFGSKGEHVITHALEAMFRTSTIPLDAIRPLNIKKFTHSFLVPYVATHAIARQLDVSITEAYTVLLESRQAGIRLHPALDSDEELDQICRSNIQQSKSNTIVIQHNETQGGPPRFRSRTWHTETTPPPQPGPSRHANALELSDCAHQGNPSPLSTLSLILPSPAARPRTHRETRSKTKPAALSAGNELKGPVRRKCARY